MQFRKGQKVRVVKSSDSKYKHVVGKTGVVFYDYDPAQADLVAVKGLEGKAREAVLGYIGFPPEDLKPA